MYQNSYKHGEHVKQLSDTIQLAMNMNNLRKTRYDSENFQVMNYGTGGSISMHLDSQGQDATPGEDINTGGLRFVTFMIYLSPVTAGGHTIFPQAGIWQKPEVGDALYWFNVDSGGFVDTRNHHMGCPTLVGNKWIANKWIHWHAQMWSYPCHAKKGHPFRPFSNNHVQSRHDI